MATVTADQAAADLKKFVSDVVDVLGSGVDELASIVVAIKNNNGVSTAAIETLIGQAEPSIANMKAAIKSAQDALNPPAVVAISVSPTSASLAPGATQQFSATVTGASDTSVTWKADSGSVDTNGLYTAPAADGTAQVTATSNADSTKSSSASVTIAG